MRKMTFKRQFFGVDADNKTVQTSSFFDTEFLKLMLLFMHWLTTLLLKFENRMKWDYVVRTKNHKSLKIKAEKTRYMKIISCNI